MPLKSLLALSAVCFYNFPVGCVARQEGFMSTLGDLKKMRVEISKQISALSVSVSDEDQKVQLTQELTTRMEEIEAEIDEIETEERAAKEAKKAQEKAAKEAKKLAKKNQKKQP
jgi:hypothetical protein